MRSYESYVLNRKKYGRISECSPPTDLMSNIYSDILSAISPGILPGFLFGIFSGILSGMLSVILSDIYSDILSGISTLTSCLTFYLACVRVRVSPDWSGARRRGPDWCGARDELLAIAVSWAPGPLIPTVTMSWQRSRRERRREKRRMSCTRVKSRDPHLAGEYGKKYQSKFSRSKAFRNTDQHQSASKPSQLNWFVLQAHICLQYKQQSKMHMIPYVCNNIYIYIYCEYVRAKYYTTSYYARFYYIALHYYVKFYYYVIFYHIYYVFICF